MVYVLIGFIILIFLIISFFKEKDKKLLEEIHLNWAKEIDKYRNFDDLEKYCTSNNIDPFHILSSQTLKDIDVENLFSILDRTSTTIGQQLLYNRIVFPTNNRNELKEFSSKSGYFIENFNKRESVQKILYRLEKNGTSEIIDTLDQKNLVINKNKPLYKILTILAIVGIMGFIFFPIIVIYSIPILAVNITVQYVFKYRNEKKYRTLSEVYGLIKAAQRLEKIDTIIDSTSIPKNLKSLKSFVKNYRFLNFGIPGDDLSKALFYFLELIKACFLTEIHLLNNSYFQILKEKESLKKLYQFIGEFDVAISTASLKSDKRFITCIPNLIEEKKTLKFTNAIHPLIDDCIPNSFSLEDKSAFITGSNMSGKSTFLRTILINSILAQTLYFCFAETYTSSFIKPFSSIKIDDNLLEGSSFFFKEVEIIKQMTEQISSANNLFIIDEIFKGTNTIERISLAKAVLHFLNNSENMVIASSHDLELIELLSSDFEMVHFTETIKENQLIFDHTIKAGSLKTTNAIKIVEIENFPKSIVDEAYKMTREFKEKPFDITVSNLN